MMTKINITNVGEMYGIEQATYVCGVYVTASESRLQPSPAPAQPLASANLLLSFQSLTNPVIAMPGHPVSSLEQL